MTILVPAAFAAANPPSEPADGRSREPWVLSAVTPPPQFPIDGNPAGGRGGTGVLFAWRWSLGVRRAWEFVSGRPVAIVFAPDAIEDRPRGRFAQPKFARPPSAARRLILVFRPVPEELVDHRRAGPVRGLQRLGCPHRLVAYRQLGALARGRHAVVARRAHHHHPV